MSRVSVIVPVYNSENTLKRCLDSIVSQTLGDIEIILVDDGSSDSSGCICDEYADADSRIRVIHKENGGLVSARKAGSAVATGEYIGFVDSDDWIEPNMYEKLYSEAEVHDADMVSSSYIQEGAYTSVSRDAAEPGFYDKERISDLRNLAILNLSKHDKGLSGSLCTKLFRSELFKNVIVRIPDGVRVSEDKITSLTFLLECNRVVIVDDAFYHYVINQTSMFHADDPDYLLNYHYVYNYFRSLYRHRKFTEKMRTQAELYIVQFLIKGINTQMGFSFRNLMWVDPSWMDDPCLGKRIAVCGDGELGRTYEKQLSENEAKEFCGFVDVKERSVPEGIDNIVIAIKDKETAMMKKEELMAMGVAEDAVCWFKQEEIFWKYVDAMGLDKQG